MKIVVERDAFADALGTVKHATDKSLKIPVLANTLLRANGAGLEIAATNLDVRSEYKLPAEIARDAAGDINEITVPVATLSDLVNRMPKGSQLSLEWDDSRTVSLVGNRLRYKLHALPASDFPILPPPDDPVTFSMPGKLFAEGLNTVKWATYDGIERPHLGGVFVHVADDSVKALGGSKKKRLAFVATDHHQLARFTAEIPVSLKGNLPHLLLPNAAIVEVSRLASGTAGDVEIAVSPTKFSITDGKAVFLTKLIDATFPEGYAAIIPDQEDARMLVDADALREALLRLKALLGNDNRIRAEASSGALVLSVTSPERGQAEERLEVEYDAAELGLPVNAGAWLQILDHMNADVCLFRFLRKSESQRPIMVNPMIGSEIDYSRSFFTMPMER